MGKKLREYLIIATDTSKLTESADLQWQNFRCNERWRGVRWVSNYREAILYVESLLSEETLKNLDYRHSASGAITFDLLGTVGLGVSAYIIWDGPAKDKNGAWRIPLAMIFRMDKSSIESKMKCEKIREATRRYVTDKSFDLFVASDSANENEAENPKFGAWEMNLVYQQNEKMQEISGYARSLCERIGACEFNNRHGHDGVNFLVNLAEVSSALKTAYDMYDVLKTIYG